MVTRTGQKSRGTGTFAPSRVTKRTEDASGEKKWNPATDADGDAMLGPVIVRQEREEGKTRPTWIAEFTVNLVKVIAKLESTKNCPSMDSWEYLNTRSWTTAESEGVWLGNKPTYERITLQAAQMKGRSVSVETISRTLDTSWETANDALVFAETGERPPARGARPIVVATDIFHQRRSSRCES